MSAKDDLDRRLSDWMTDTVAGPPPAGRFEEVMEATARRRPRPSWLAALGSDWVGTAAPRRVEPTMPIGRREFLIAAGLALLTAAAIAGAAIVGAQLVHTNQSAIPGPVSNGWIAFAQDGDMPPPAGTHYGIYLVGEHQAARRIVGTDSDTVDRVCPAFSPDGARLAFGQVDPTSGTGDRDAALVIVDVDADGTASDSRTIAVGGPFPAPCPVWSPDGQRIAFTVPGIDDPAAPGTPVDPQPAGAGAVWVVTPDSGQVAKLEGVWAGDLGWAPDGSQLAIVTGATDPHSPLQPGGSIVLYSVQSGAASQLAGPSAVTALAWSPDGSAIAYQRIKTLVAAPDGGMAGRTQEIWTIAPDGSGATLQTGTFDTGQGQGPAWSPDGTRMVYQRCAHPCREPTDVVLLAPGATVSATSPVGSEVVLPHVEMDASDPGATWWPFTVSWSPDGRKLLYDAWNDSHPVGLVVVDVAGGSPPMVLATTDVAAGGAGDFGVGGNWVRPFSSWGRQPGGRDPRSIETPAPAADRSPHASAG